MDVDYMLCDIVRHYTLHTMHVRNQVDIVWHLLEGKEI